MSTTETEAERLQHELDKADRDRDFWRQTALDMFDQFPLSIEEMREFLSDKQIRALQYELNKPPRPTPMSES